MNNRLPEEDSIGRAAVLVHLGLLIFGMSALLTGQMADDYKKMNHAGFDLHSWIGIGAILFVFLRMVTGVFGSVIVRFDQWVPYTRDRLRLVQEDILGLLKFRIPERPVHQGIAGLVQTFGLLVFLFMSTTGAVMLIFMEPGRNNTGVVHAVKEAHEIGIILIPLFLAMHVGAVVLHALRGNHIWRKMFFRK
jgi:cytochrome b